MKLPSGMNWSRMIIVIFLFLLAILLAAYREDAKQVVRLVFDSNTLPIGVWIYVAVAVASQKLFATNEHSSQFESYAEALFSVGTYGFAGTTSLTLLQGVFMQHFYDTKFFLNFGSLDLVSIALVSSYLLIYCGITTSKMIADVIFKVQGSTAKPPSPL